MTADITRLLAAGIIAYALGNINPSIIISRVFYKTDIRKEGSGNAGTTNTIRVLGLAPGLICLAIDILKGTAAVIIGHGMAGAAGGMTAFALVILGHCFPAAWGFKGGKGVACALGSALALNWPSAVAALAVAAMFLAVTRRMSVGSIAALVAYPVFIWHFAPEYLYFAIGAALFLVLMHISNIERLIKGEEKALTIGHKSRGGADASVLADSETGEPHMPAEPTDYYAGTEIPDLGEDACRIAVIGNGSFGTAIANLLTHNGHDVTLYGRKPEALAKMRETRMNERYLPNAILSDRIRYTSDLREAVTGRKIVVFAVPTQQFRSVSESCSDWLEDGVIAVNLAKGIEQKTLLRPSEIAKETIPAADYVALSGPSHAEEIVRNLPASVVAASVDRTAAERIQDVFMSDKFRVYTQDDIAGVEIAGAVKNVIAITTGISDGMDLGNNARAALMTRAVHEIARLGKAIGADPETFSGLSGIGDLIVTCSTNLSRNRRCGLLIGHGLTAEEAVKKVGSVVEGYYTAEAVCELSEKYDVEMPICRITSSILKGKLEPEKALGLLMSRSKKDELQ